MASSSSSSLFPGLEQVTEPFQILALLNDKRNDNITADDSILQYTNPKNGEQELFNGLVPILTKVFWPDDEFKTRKNSLDASKKRAKDAAKSRLHGMNRKELSGPPVKGKSKAAAAQGKGHFANGIIRGKRSHKQFEDAHVLDAENFERKYGSMSLDTRAMFEAYDELGIMRVTSEFCDYSEKLGIAVRHDGIGVKRDGTVVFIEQKTGSRNCFEADSGIPMQGCLTGIMPDSELSRAMMQLAVSVQITLHKRPYIKRWEAFVLRPTDESRPGSKCKAKVYPLSKDFLREYGGLIITDITAFRKREGKLREPGKRKPSKPHGRSGSSGDEAEDRPRVDKRRIEMNPSSALFEGSVGKKQRRE